jgi:multidrug efflux pump subunit AcrA (membrane-fusion protein)
VDVEVLRVGAKATVHFDAYPGLSLPGRVIAVGAMPKSGGQRATWVKEIPVRLKLDQLDPRIIPDLSVSVDVQLAAEENATIAPISGVFEDENGSFVFVTGEDGKWQRKPVELGGSNFLAAIIRSGLRPGEVIAAEWPAGEPKRK